MAKSKMQKTARNAAISLLDAGETQRKWTPETRRHWTRAFNALNRLAGLKTQLRVR